jgi:hypothetical protein
MCYSLNYSKSAVSGLFLKASGEPVLNVAACLILHWPICGALESSSREGFSRIKRTEKVCSGTPESVLRKG